MKSVHHFAMQQLRSPGLSALQAEMAADSQHQLLTSTMIHGLQRQRHQPVVDGVLHLQPTNRLSNKRFLSDNKPFLIQKIRARKGAP